MSAVHDADSTGRRALCPLRLCLATAVLVDLLIQPTGASMYGEGKEYKVQASLLLIST